MARMVIVGAGECGARAALTLREQGYEGSVVLIGEEAHPPYERPPLSKEAMIDEAEPIAKAVAGDRLAEAGVELVTGTQVSSLDPVSKTVATSNGRRFGYDKLLLATGAAPRRLKLANNSQRSVYLRTFNDALTIRACLKARVRVAIIGGGFIGLELAAAARNHGCGVSVIEAQARILMRGVPAEIAAMIQAEHDRQGVRTLCGRGISAIDDVDDRALVQLADGEAVEADLVIIAIGVQSPIPCSPRLRDWRSKTASRSTTDCAPAIPRSSLQATAALSPCRSTVDDGCDSRLGGAPRSRGHLRR